MFPPFASSTTLETHGFPIVQRPYVAKPPYSASAGGPPFPLASLKDADNYGILRLARQSPELFQHLWWCSAGLVIGCFLSMGMLQEDSELRRHLDPMIPVMGGAMTWIFGRMLQFSEELAQSKQRWELQQKNMEPLLQAKMEAQKSREDAESFRKEAEALRKQVEAIQKQAANQASEPLSKAKPVRLV
ncbi:unnamed protein product [Cladocopium goreaui]|uniref:Uncharacterized protein n=1 Tax=Cladocopium goreaui TaxID=2562237 RepID=A0A9P1FTC6_9DINO|nr:unnamed protein product [Cladocopium goreaui]